MLFRFRDSLNLLPGSLNSLASSLCPELGTKGYIDHENVTLSNLASNKKTLLDYMKQDILLLGGVMRKAILPPLIPNLYFLLHILFQL